MVSHVNCNQAPKMRRRTYRAHGRINGKFSLFYVYPFVTEHYH